MYGSGLNAMRYDPDLVVGQYGAVLELSGERAALPDRLLPYPKEVIKRAIRTLILNCGIDDPLLWALQQGYLSLARFRPETQVEEIERLHAALELFDPRAPGTAVEPGLLLSSAWSDQMSERGDLLGELAELMTGLEARGSQLSDATAKTYMDHFNRGCEYGEQRRWDEAVAEYRAAIEITPVPYHAYLNLGNAYCELGDFGEAAAYLREAVRRKPDLAVAHYNLGNALVKMGRWAEAVQVYRAAIMLDPTLATAHYNLALCYIDLGDKVRAIEIHRVLTKLDAVLAHSLLSHMGQ